LPKSIGAGYNYGVIDEPAQFGKEHPADLNKEDFQVWIRNRTSSSLVGHFSREFPWG
jgi:hypothetical protein